MCPISLSSPGHPRGASGGSATPESVLRRLVTAGGAARRQAICTRKRAASFGRLNEPDRQQRDRESKFARFTATKKLVACYPNYSVWRSSTRWQGVAVMREIGSGETQ